MGADMEMSRTDCEPTGRGERASGEAPARSAPLVVHVGQPRAAKLLLPIWAIVGGLLAVVVVTTIVTHKLIGLGASMVAPVAVLVLGIVFFRFAWLGRVRDFESRWGREPSSEDEHPLAATLRKDWYAPFDPPSGATIRSHLVEIGEWPPPRATIVCLGEARMPPPDDYRFDPVVRPYGLLRQFYVGGIGMVIVASVMLAVQLTTGQPFNLSPTAWIAIAAIVGTFFLVGSLSLAWHSSYIRIAPGVIQILTFTAGRHRAAVRNYEMKSGTLAIVTDVPGKRSLTLMHRYETDIVSLDQVRNADDVLERIGWALMSTAPTPPLSDEELVG